MPYDSPFMSQWEATQYWANRERGGGAASIPVTGSAGASGIPPTTGMNLTSLSDYINNINRTATTAAQHARIPGAAGLEDISSRNIGADLSGQVDPDILRNLQQQAAERGVGMGIDPSSPNVNTEYLRALGLTAYDLKQRGQAELGAAYARNPAAPIFDPSTQVMTPYQAGQLDLERRRLAIEASRGYGGGGGGRPTGTITGESVAPPTTRTGATGADLADFLRSGTDPTAAWWASIGYTPGTGGTGPGYSYISPGRTTTTDTGGISDSDLYNLTNYGVSNIPGEQRPERDEYGNLVG